MKDSSLAAPLEKEKHPLLNMDGASLLTLSRADLHKQQTTVNNDGKENDKDNDLLALIQLPSSLSIKDLCSGRIIAKENQQACLVVEKTGQSFGICRVETSNCLVLAPPPPTSSVSEEPPCKRAKTGTKNKFAPIPSRLLQPGASESSFLEVKERDLNLKDLAKLLEPHVFSPYGGSDADQWQGQTLEDLAMELQFSKRQVQQGLKTLGAFGMPRHDNKVIGYGILSEEAIQEAQQAIVATLMECDEFADFCDKPVLVELIVKEAKNRMESEEAYPQVEHVLRHCLTTLLAASDEEAADNVRLDFNKVALFVAHRMFQTQANPWEESAFLTKWHSELPGVDKAPSMDMLQGVAICKETLTGERHWKYFPQDKLPIEPQERFERFFGEKRRWTLEQLEPYLQRLVVELSMSQSELLVRYARAETEDVDGVSTKFYVKR